MLNEIGLDQYLEIKEDIELGVVVFFLGGKFNHLISDSHWLCCSSLEVYIVKMTVEDFKSMDIGVHPKTFIIKEGREIFEINGIPSEDALGELYGSR
jgi:hypothetical protein